ncbi:MAG: tetratricopeptide repeat protein [Lachnospiraceae bacterium]
MKYKLVLAMLCVGLSLTACSTGGTTAASATEESTQEVTQALPETAPVEASTEAVSEAATEAETNASAASAATEEETTAEAPVTMDMLREEFAIQVDTDGKSADDLYKEGQKYENGDGEVVWYGKAMAYYQAAKEAGSAEAEDAIENLEAFRDDKMSEENSPDGQGWIFEYFRKGVSAGQAGDWDTAYAINHDDVFFFEDPLYRGLDEMATIISKDNTEESVQNALNIYTYCATNLGKGKSYSAIGKLYQADDGTYAGITHSMDTAIDYYEKAYQLDGLLEKDNKAPRYLGEICEAGYTKDDGTVVPPDEEKAVEYYLTADELGETTACYHLAVCYQNGLGVDQDYAKSAAYYEKAVDGSHSTQLGIPQSYLALGQLYENGLGVTQDTDKAVSYYEQARDAAQDNLDLVNTGASDLDMQGIHDEAVEALSRLQNT